MKRKFFLSLGLGILAILVGFDFFTKWQKPKQNTNQEVLGEPAPEYRQVTEILFKNKTYKAAWYKVLDTDALALIPNFGPGLSAQEVLESQKCTFIVSAGFYRKAASSAYEPTGLFIAEDKVLKEFSANNLLNGVFSVNYFGTPRITRTRPQDELRLAVQTGPILIENTFVQKAKLTSDEEARRVVVAVTGANEVFFLVFWDPESFFNGPYLADLPELVKEAEAKMGVVFADVVNLDGGAASAFMDGLKLSEAKKVGSFFCVKD